MRFNRRRLTGVLITLAAACFVLLSSHGAAQEDRYVGTVDDALAAIEVVSHHATGAPESTRRANGFVLRSDGFLLAPMDVFAESADTVSQKMSVLLHPGTDHVKRLDNLAIPRLLVAAASEYVAFRVNGVRAPALRTRLLSGPETVTLVCAPWSGSRYGPILRIPAKTVPVKSATGAARNGVVDLATPVPDAMPGAIVLGEDGLAVGMVTGSMEGTATGYLSFEELYRVTNCVTPVPTTDESFRKSEDALPADQRMLPVTGGRLSIPSDLLREQPDMNGAREVSVAPFAIDRFEVTNAEYLDFWRSLPPRTRDLPDGRQRLYPAGWAPSEPAFPDGIARLPVLGVSIEGARAYARWRGKRLPTPCEWLMAAFGPGGEASVPAWVKRYLEARRRAWESIGAQHAVFARDNAEFMNRELEPQSVGTPPARRYEIPFIPRTAAGRGVASLSKSVVERETLKIADEWANPNRILARGSRSFDVSPCGARDMILDAAEMFAPSPAPPARGALRYWRVDWLLARPTDDWTPGLEPGLFPAAPPTLLSSLTDRSLNRLVSCTYRQDKPSGFTLANITYTVSSLQEQTALLVPLSGWTLRIGSQMEMRGSLKPSTLDAVDRYLATGVRLWTYQRDGFGVWQQVPRDYSPETGRTVALHALDLPIPPVEPGDSVRPENSALTWLLPVGFRCAR